MIVNGKNVTLDAPVSLRSYLESIGYDLSRIAVEKNGVIIPKGSFDTEMLCDDDTIEIVSFVGGG